jgi:hypothetical protein
LAETVFIAGAVVLALFLSRRSANFIMRSLLIPRVSTSCFSKCGDGTILPQSSFSMNRGRPIQLSGKLITAEILLSHRRTNCNCQLGFTVHSEPRPNENFSNGAIWQTCK